MPHIEDVLLFSLTQAGDPYIFGAEAKATDPNPDAFDCSELVEWACARAGVLPVVPDGAYYQWQHCSKYRTNIPVERGMDTRGALLFVGDGTGVGRAAITHVAWSLGDGTTIEARGSRWGVGTWPSVGRFDFAGLVPGVDYSPRLLEELDMADVQTILDKLQAIELRQIALDKKFDALAADVPDNIAAELDEIRINLRRDLKADGVPATEIQK